MIVKYPLHIGFMRIRGILGVKMRLFYFYNRKSATAPPEVVSGYKIIVN
jgi:hypothetical protein